MPHLDANDVRNAESLIHVSTNLARPPHRDRSYPKMTFGTAAAGRAYLSWINGYMLSASASNVQCHAHDSDFREDLLEPPSLV